MTGTPENDGIGARILSGLAWKAGSQVFTQILRMVVALVLARMLTPEQWGLAAMVLVFSGFVIVFTDNALGTALIQRRRLTDDDRSTVFWASAAVGLLLAAIAIAFSGALASFYGEPEVRPLFAVLAISFFVSSLGTAQGALLVREMQFRKLELRQMAAALAAAVTGIAVAAGGYGAWAIVTQQLVDATVSTVIVWFLIPWRPSPRFSVESLRKLGGFAGNVFGENMLYQAGRNIANLATGRVLGAAALGTYALATNVILMPFSRIAAPLQQVFFPAFSQMQGDRPRMAQMWIRVTRLVAAFAMPALAGLVIVAPDFVQVVLGNRWHDATLVIQILAWAGLIQSLQTLSGEILLALNKSGTLLRFTMLWFVVTLGAIALGLQWGLTGLAVCYTVAIVVVEPVRTYLAASALGISVWRFYGALVGVAQATLAMAAVVFATRQALIAAGVPAAGRLVLLILLGVAVYVPLCAWRVPEVVAEVKRVSSRRQKATGHLEPLPAQPQLSKP